MNNVNKLMIKLKRFERKLFNKTYFNLLHMLYHMPVTQTCLGQYM